MKVFGVTLNDRVAALIRLGPLIAQLNDRVVVFVQRNVFGLAVSLQVHKVCICPAVEQGCNENGRIVHSDLIGWLSQLYNRRLI